MATVRGIGILLILIGSALFYFQGHKDNGLVTGSSYIVLFIGWIVIYLSITPNLGKTKVTFKKNRSKWIKEKAKSAITLLTIGVLIAANFFFVNSLIEKRVTDILTNQPSNQTVGIIKKIESRNSRGGPKEYAIIEYTANGEQIQQPISNYESQFFVGQKVEMIYSSEYPEMFQLIRTTL